jgi:hypothetical protein
MQRHYSGALFAPDSDMVLRASDRSGSAGGIVSRNLIDGAGGLFRW